MWRANRGKMQREKAQRLAQHTVRRGEPGFTLIELLLAMSFLSVLLIAITTSTLQIIGLYTKGVTLKSINLAGRDVADSFRRDALASADGIRYVSPDKGGGLGRLCFGTMSYVWSPAAKLQQGSAIRYQNDTRQGDARGDMIVLARVADAGAQYCNPTARGTYSTDVFLSKATELLGSRVHTPSTASASSLAPTSKIRSTLPTRPASRPRMTVLIITSAPLIFLRH